MNKYTKLMVAMLLINGMVSAMDGESDEIVWLSKKEIEMKPDVALIQQSYLQQSTSKQVDLGHVLTPSVSEPVSDKQKAIGVLLSGDKEEEYSAPAPAPATASTPAPARALVPAPTPAPAPAPPAPTIVSAPAPAPTPVPASVSNKMFFKPTVWSRLGFDTSSKVCPSNDQDDSQPQTLLDFRIVNLVMQRDKIFGLFSALFGLGSYVAAKNDKPEVAVAAGVLSVVSLASSICSNAILADIKEANSDDSMSLDSDNKTFVMQWFKEWEKERFSVKSSNGGKTIAWPLYLEKKQKRLKEIHQDCFNENINVVVPSVVQHLLRMKPKNN